MIDIVVPILNEEEVLYRNRAYFLSLREAGRLIFVDGGSSDNSRKRAAELGEVITSPKGRGIQKNTGAFTGSGGIILFLHVDTRLDPAYLEDMKRVCANGSIGGCFKLRIDDKGFVFRMYEWAVNVRARYRKIIDGDLGMFVKRDIFEACGGMDEIMYLEDLTFSRQLKRRGRLAFIDKPIMVSSRRWHEQGFLKTFWFYTQAYMRLWTRTFKRVEGVNTRTLS